MPYFGVPIRNGLPIGLGSQAGFGIAPFDPRDLFSAGEQGAWYDPSDYSTLFTDSAGTTPVTGVEQFVGLMLDKSKGAPTTLGSDVVTNGDFSGGSTGWSAQAGWTIGSGAASVNSAVAGATYLRTSSFSAVAGRTYQVTFTITSYTSGSIRPAAGDATGVSFSVAGTYTSLVVASGVGGVGVFATSTNTVATVDNISVREIPGNHATSTGTKRPKLAARYNLLTYTEQFDHAIWTKNNVTVTANTVVAPNGATTADSLIEDGTNDVHRISQTAAVTSGAAYTIFVYVRKANVRYFQLVGSSPTFFPTGNGAWFDLDTGIASPGTSTAATMTAVGNGWYLCSITMTAVGTGTSSFFFNPSDNNSSPTYQGVNGRTSVYLWGADLRPASQATGLIGPTYQRVVDAATYDTAGFLPYLQFDGIDDSMSTNSIDFSAGDKMTVWAGVRKLSDATTGTVFETSATYSGNNGSFALFSAYAANTHAVTARGSTGNGEAVVSTFTAPITNVISGSINLALNSVSSVLNVRVNGVVPSTAYTPTPGSAMGVGNFGNYPLFIGQRNNTNFPFNGWLSSLIIRGAQSTQSQIEATESWVNGRTGAF